MKSIQDECFYGDETAIKTVLVLLQDKMFLCRVYSFSSYLPQLKAPLVKLTAGSKLSGRVSFLSVILDLRSIPSEHSVTVHFF